MAHDLYELLLNNCRTKKRWSESRHHLLSSFIVLIYCIFLKKVRNWTMSSRITNSREISIKDYYLCGKWSSTSGCEIWRCKKCHHGENGISKCLPLEIFLCSMLITKPRDIMVHDHIWPYYGSKIVIMGPKS